MSRHNLTDNTALPSFGLVEAFLLLTRALFLVPHNRLPDLFLFFG